MKQDIVSCDISIFENWRCRSQEDRQKAIEELYSNAYFVLVRIFGRACQATTCLVDLKQRIHNDARARKKWEQADSVNAFFLSLGIDKQWDDLHFLNVVIACLPKTEKITARKVLNHYRSHLRSFRMATSIRDRKVVRSVSDGDDKEGNLAPWEIKVDKDIEECTWEECVTMGNRFFGVALKVPEDCILSGGARPGSTTLIFMVPKTSAKEIKE